jgi:glycerate-2-kinase
MKINVQNPNLLCASAVNSNLHSSFSVNYAPIINEILAAADPSVAVHRFMQCDGKTLWCDNRAYDLAEIDRVFVVGAGKASGRMAEVVE